MYFPRKKNSRIELPIHTVREELLFRYTSAERELNGGQARKKLDETQRTTLLFKIFSEYIVEMKWKYLPQGSKHDLHGVLKRKHGEPHEVNCFDLSEAFLSLCQHFKFKNVEKIIYRHKAGKKLGVKHAGLSDPLQCFDGEHYFTDNEFIFDQHCIVKINDCFYDLTFSCYYDDIDAPIDTSLHGKIVSAIDASDSKEAVSLLKQNPRFNLNQTFEGWTLLHRATHAGLTQLVIYLLDHGADPHIKNKQEIPCLPLDLVTNTKSELFKVIASKTEASIVEAVKRKNKNLLFLNAFDMIEAYRGDITKLIELFNQGLEINEQDAAGWTLLHWTVFHKQADIVKWLLENKADSNLRNNDGDLPLSFCDDVESNIFEMLEKNTDPH